MVIFLLESRVGFKLCDCQLLIFVFWVNIFKPLRKQNKITAKAEICMGRGEGNRNASKGSSVTKPGLDWD